MWNKMEKEMQKELVDQLVELKVERQKLLLPKLSVSGFGATATASTAWTCTKSECEAR